MKIIITRDTYIKTSTDQSSELSETEKHPLSAGTELEIAAFLPEDRHIKFTIANREDDVKGRNTWYCFDEHCEIDDPQPSSNLLLLSTNQPVITTLANKNTGPSISLPGYSSPFYLNNPIYPGSNFTWSEATKHGSRLPSEKSQVDNIIAVSKKLDLIRDYLGNRSMIITSWLRPPHINRAVGGVPNSRHITGDGVDFTVPSLNMYKVQENLKSFCQEHNMGLGLGAKRGNFVHVDLNGWRCWPY